MKKKLLVFSARYCGKCYSLKKRLKRLQEKKTVNFEYEIIDVETDTQTKDKYFVEGIPTIVYLKDNQEIDRISGTISKEKLIELMNRGK